MLCEARNSMRKRKSALLTLSVRPLVRLLLLYWYGASLLFSLSRVVVHGDKTPDVSVTDVRGAREGGGPAAREGGDPAADREEEGVEEAERKAAAENRRAHQGPGHPPAPPSTRPCPGFCAGCPCCCCCGGERRNRWDMSAPADGAAAPAAEAK